MSIYYFIFFLLTSRVENMASVTYIKGMTTHFISSLFCTPFYLFSPFLCRLSFSLFILSPHTAITPSYNVSTPLSKWPGNTRTGSRGIKGRINILTGLLLFSLPVHVSCPTHTHTQPCHLPSTFIHLPQDSPSLCSLLSYARRVGRVSRAQRSKRMWSRVTCREEGTG